MKFTGFQIKNYKCIGDSGYVKVDPRITTLIGKNESGKTSIFTALWKSLNVAGVTFDRLYDYPRDRYIRDRSDVQEVTLLSFELSEEEVRELGAHLLRDPADIPRRITVTTSYLGEEGVRSTLAFEATPPLLAAGTGAPAAPPAPAEADRSALVPPNDARADRPDEAPADPTAIWLHHPAEFNEPEEGEPAGRPSEVAVPRPEAGPGTTGPAASAPLPEAHPLAEAKPDDMEERAREWVTAALPTFIYFSDYDRLEGRIHLPTYLVRRRAADPKVRTQSVLFAWSGLDPEEILELSRDKQDAEGDEEYLRRRETRDTLLETAAFSLTGDWDTWWKEKRHRLHFGVEGEDLVLKVSDQHSNFPVPFHERSEGFQWFFSFYLVFLSESERAHGDAILLLDEPGLHLHPMLQSELTGFFQRISDGNQLLYSTHLPYLIDAHHLERIRTVHLAGGETRTTRVANEIRPADHLDTLSPLQSALGPATVQTLLLGRRPITLEGTADFWLLRALNECLDADERRPLFDRDTVLIPAGGRERLIPLAFVVLAASGADRSVVLLDSDREGQKQAAHLRDVLGEDAPILLVGDLLNHPGATIEDLVPRDVYAEAAQPGRSTYPLDDSERAAGSNLEAVAGLFERNGIGRFGKAERARAALALTDAWNRDPSSVPQPTRERARRLVDAIDRYLARLPTAPEPGRR